MKKLLFISICLALIVNSQAQTIKARSNPIMVEVSQPPAVAEADAEIITLEALGMNKKMITNNRSVMEYDFYNPNNILVIDFDNLVIPKEFFQTPYQPLDAAIKQKYHLRSFVKTVLSNLEN